MLRGLKTHRLSHLRSVEHGLFPLLKLQEQPCCLLMIWDSLRFANHVFSLEMFDYEFQITKYFKITDQGLKGKLESTNMLRVSPCCWNNPYVKQKIMVESCCLGWQKLYGFALCYFGYDLAFLSLSSWKLYTNMFPTHFGSQPSWPLHSGGQCLTGVVGMRWAISKSVSACPLMAFRDTYSIISLE